MCKALSILVDCDGVLEDLNTEWVAAINKKYNTCVAPESITEWNIAKFFPALSRTQVFSPLHKREFWRSLLPMDGAIQILYQLIQDGHEIFIVTSSHPDTVSYKIEFLKKYFDFIPYKNVIITSNKQMVKGDVLIDDAPHNLVGGDYQGILFSAPHNKSFNEKEDGFIRVDDWAGVYNAVNSIAKEDGVYECN